MSSGQRRVQRPEGSEKIVYPRGVSGFFITDNEADELQSAFMPFYEKAMQEAVDTQNAARKHITEDMSTEERLRFAMFGYQEHGDLAELRMMCERVHDVLIQIGIRNHLLSPNDVAAIQQMRIVFNADGSTTVNSADLQRHLSAWQDAIASDRSAYTKAQRRESDKIYAKVVNNMVFRGAKEDDILNYAANRTDADRYEKIIALLEQIANQASFEQEGQYSVNDVIADWAQKDPAGARRTAFVKRPVAAPYEKQKYQKMPEGISISTSKYKYSRTKIMHTDFMDTMLVRLKQAQRPVLTSEFTLFSGDELGAAAAGEQRPSGATNNKNNAKAYIDRLIEQGDFSSMEAVMKYVHCQAFDASMPATEAEKDISEILKKLYQEYVDDIKETRLRGLSEIITAIVQLSTIPKTTITEALERVGMPTNLVSAFHFATDTLKIPKTLLQQTFQIAGLNPDVATWLGGTVFEGAIATLREMASFSTFSRQFAVTHHTRPSFQMDILQARESARIDFQAISSFQMVDAQAAAFAEEQAATIKDADVKKDYMAASSLSFPDDMYPSMVENNFSYGSSREPRETRSMSIATALSYVAASLPTFPAALHYLKKIIPNHEPQVDPQFIAMMKDALDTDRSIGKVLTQIVTEKRETKGPLIDYINSVKDYLIKRSKVETDAIEDYSTRLMPAAGSSSAPPPPQQQETTKTADVQFFIPAGVAEGAVAGGLIGTIGISFVASAMTPFIVTVGVLSASAYSSYKVGELVYRHYSAAVDNTIDNEKNTVSAAFDKLSTQIRPVTDDIQKLAEQKTSLDQRHASTETVIESLTELANAISNSKSDTNRQMIIAEFQRQHGKALDASRPSLEEIQILLSTFVKNSKNFSGIASGIFSSILQSDLPQEITGAEFEEISNILNKQTTKLSKEEERKVYEMAERVRVLQSKLRAASGFPALYTPKTHNLFNEIQAAMEKPLEQRGDMKNFFLPKRYTFDMILQKHASGAKDFRDLYADIVKGMSDAESKAFQLTVQYLQTLLTQEQYKCAMSNVAYREKLTTNAAFVEYLKLSNSQPASHYERSKKETMKAGFSGIEASIQAFIQLERIVEGNTQYISVLTRPVVELFRDRHQREQGISVQDCTQAASLLRVQHDVLTNAYGALFQKENQSDYDYNTQFQESLKTVSVDVYREIARKESVKRQIEHVREIQRAVDHLNRITEDFTSELRISFGVQQFSTVTPPISDASEAWPTAPKDWQELLERTVEDYKKSLAKEPTFVDMVDVVSRGKLKELYKDVEERIPTITKQINMSEVARAIKYITDASYRNSVSPSAALDRPGDAPTTFEKERQATTLSGLLTSYLSMFNTYSVVARGIWGLADVIGFEITSLADTTAETLRHRILMLAYEIKCSEEIERVIGRDEYLLNSMWLPKRARNTKTYAVGQALIFYLNAVHYNRTGMTLPNPARAFVSTLLSQFGPTVVSAYTGYLASIAAEGLIQTFGVTNPLATSAVYLLGVGGSAAATFYAGQSSIRKAVTMTIAIGGLFWFGWGVIAFNTLAELTTPTAFYLKTAAWGIRTSAQLLGGRTARKTAIAAFERTFDLFFGCSNPLYIAPEALYARMLTANVATSGGGEHAEHVREQIMRKGVYSSRRNFIVLMLKNTFGASASSIGNYAAEASLDNALRLIDSAKVPNEYTNLAVQETLNSKILYSGNYAPLFDTMLMSARQIDESLQTMGIRYFTGISLESTFLSTSVLNFYGNFIVAFVNTMFVEDATNKAIGIQGQIVMIEQEVARLQDVLKKRKELKTQYEKKAGLKVHIDRIQREIEEIQQDLEKRKQVLAKLSPAKSTTKGSVTTITSTLAFIGTLIAGKVALSAISYSSYDSQLLGAFFDLINDNLFTAIAFAGGFIFLTKLITTFRTWADRNREGKMGTIVQALATVGIAICSFLMANSLQVSSLDNSSMARVAVSMIDKAKTVFSTPRDALVGMLSIFENFKPSSEQLNTVVNSTTTVLKQTLNSQVANDLFERTTTKAWSIFVTAQSTSEFTNAIGFLLAFLKNMGDFAIPAETPEQMKQREERALDTLVGFERDRRESRIAFEVLRARDPIRSRTNVLLDSEISTLIDSYPPTFSYDGLMRKFKEVLSCKLAFPKNMDKVLKLRQELISTNFASESNFSTFMRILYLSILIRHPETKRLVDEAANSVTEPIRFNPSIVAQSKKSRIVQDIVRPLWIHFYAFVFEYARVLKFYKMSTR